MELNFKELRDKHAIGNHISRKIPLCSFQLIDNHHIFGQPALPNRKSGHASRSLREHSKPLERKTIWIIFPFSLLFSLTNPTASKQPNRSLLVYTCFTRNPGMSYWRVIGELMMVGETMSSNERDAIKLSSFLCRCHSINQWLDGRRNPASGTTRANWTVTEL